VPILIIAARRGGARTQFPISLKLGIKFAIHRDNYCNSPRLQFEELKGAKLVSENDAIFCNFNFKEIGIAKNGIVFPIFNFFEIGN
jgi:hypothetical protein